MKRLTDDQTAERDSLLESLNNARTTLDDAVTNYNEKVATAFESVTDALGAFNDALAEAEQFVGDVSGAQSDYVAERSEKWADSDAGIAYTVWATGWEEAISALDAVDLEEPDPFELPDEIESRISTLEDLESEP